MHAVSNEKALVWREPEKLRGGGGIQGRKEVNKWKKIEGLRDRDGWRDLQIDGLLLYSPFAVFISVCRFQTVLTCVTVVFAKFVESKGKF